MDLLDRVLGAGRDLLARVDSALVVSGAPPDHAIWPLARRVGALPGDAAESIAALRPEPLVGCAARLRSLADGYEQQRASLAAITEAGVWEGASAAAFANQIRAFAAHVGTPADDGLAGRLASTASYVEDVAAWITEARRTLAGALATVMASAEAVRLHDGTDEPAAAAAIGVRLLEAAGTVHAAGEAVRQRWTGRLDELAYRPPADIPPPSGDATRVTL